MTREHFEAWWDAFERRLPVEDPKALAWAVIQRCETRQGELNSATSFAEGWMHYLESVREREKNRPYVTVPDFSLVLDRIRENEQ